MFNSKLLGDANFGMVSFKMLIYLTINYITKIDHFTTWDGDRLIGFESILEDRHVWWTKFFFVIKAKLPQYIYQCTHCNGLSQGYARAVCLKHIIG